jgi:hypothetical protein
MLLGLPKLLSYAENLKLGIGAIAFASYLVLRGAGIWVNYVIEMRKGM